MHMYTPALTLVAYVLMPLWLAAGFADWLCHRASAIERTSGAKESTIHLLLFAEAGVPALAALFFQPDALILLALMLGFVLHELTALWDVSYAVTLRYVSPLEQLVHSFLELIPLMLILLHGIDNWPQWLAVFGVGDVPADFGLHWRTPALPAAYLAVLLVGVAVMEVLPYAEELARGLRAKRGAFLPRRAREP